MEVGGKTYALKMVRESEVLSLGSSKQRDAHNRSVIRDGRQHQCREMLAIRASFFFST